jgi:hypothetical protein
MFLMFLGADELATFANNLALSVTTSPEFYDAREAKLSALGWAELRLAGLLQAAVDRLGYQVPSTPSFTKNKVPRPLRHERALLAVYADTTPLNEREPKISWGIGGLKRLG